MMLQRARGEAYRASVTAALSKVSTENYREVMAPAELAMDIRGYGEVQLRTLRGVLARWRALEQALGIATLTLEVPAPQGEVSTVPAVS